MTDRQKTLPPKRKCPVGEGERFIRLYELIVEIYRAYVANFVWTVGLFAVAIGWFLNSTESRMFIRSSPVAFGCTLAAVSIIALIHSGASWAYCQRSRQRVTQMATHYEDLQPLPFRDYEIRVSIFLMNLGVSITLAVGLIVFLVVAYASEPLTIGP